MKPILPLACAALMASATTLTALSVNHTGLLTESHTHLVTPDSLRINLRNLTTFVVRNTGERRNRTGELHRIWVEMSADGEFDSYTLTPAMLTPASGRDSNGTYIEIDDPDRVRITAPRPAALDDLWVNVARGSEITLTFRFRELDCKGDNVCNRDNSGSYTVAMTLPALPTTLPTTCTAANRFTISLLDDVPTFFGPAAPVRMTRQASGDVLLHPTDGTLCITQAIAE